MQLKKRFDSTYIVALTAMAVLSAISHILGTQQIQAKERALSARQAAISNHLGEDGSARQEAAANAQTNQLQLARNTVTCLTWALCLTLAVFQFHPLGKQIGRALAALADNEKRFEAFMDNGSMVAFMKDEDGRYVYTNRTFQRQFRHAPAIAGKSDAEIMPPDVARTLRANDRKVLMEQRSATMLELVPDDNGETRHFLSVKFPFANRDGERFLGGVSIDITDRVAAEEALRASEKRWQLALRGTNDGLWDWNAVTNEAYYSPRWKQMLGYTDDDLHDLTDEWERRVHPEDLPRVKQELEAHLSRRTPYYMSEYRMRCRDGSYRWVLARGQAVWDEHGKPVRMAGSHTDITDRKAAEERLTHDAGSDPLTQLSNRRRLSQQLVAAFQTARLRAEPLSVCLCDIDRFKQVNDGCGHAVGDRVLSTFSQVLRESLRSTDIAGRLGGDEFCIVLPGVHAKDAQTTMDRVRVRLEHMLFAHPDGKPFHVSATFGVAELTPHQNSEAELMEAADRALYEGKRGGRNMVKVLPRGEQSISA